MKKYLLLLICIAATSIITIDAQTLAFPTAEGFGSLVTGGRGGKVVAVTNLEDDALNPPEGSFRWALQQYPGEPLTVVFKVSGVIELAPYKSNTNKGDLRCKRNNFTIAGQTAPGDGICIKGNKVNFGGSTNFIIRHMRFRIGIMLDGEGNHHADGNGSIGIENASDFIIDHCTFGWSGEENMTIYDNHRTTIQWCIVHEGLYLSGHNKGNRSYASQWGGSSATYHHNLLAHNYSRSPRFNGSRSNDHEVINDYVNNVNYNWGKANSCYGADFDSKGKIHHVNFVNNYYKPGPARPANKVSYFVQSTYGNQSADAGQIAVWWMSGNVMEGNAEFTKNNYLGLDASQYPEMARDKLIAKTAFDIAHPVKTQTAQEAYESVLEGAGAFPRDAVDTRIVEEVKAGTASGSGVLGQKKGIIDNPEAVGGYPVYNSKPALADSDGDGMPDEWELANGLNPNDPTDGNKLTVSGYTALEVYLNSLVGEIIELDFNLSSIDIQKPEEPKIYFNSSVELKIESESKISKLDIYDAMGRLITSHLNPASTIDLPAGLNGILIVKFLLNEKDHYASKVLKI